MILQGILILFYRDNLVVEGYTESGILGKDFLNALESQDIRKTL
jgi:hypothetical protein